MDKDKFIELLNKALEFEYAAAIQYIQHSALLNGPEYFAIASELISHAKQEMEHAETVSNILVDLKAIPSIRVEKRETANDSPQMLSQDLAGEEIAIKIYKELILMAEGLGEYGKCALLKEILVDEEDHRRDLLLVLGKK